MKFKKELRKTNHTPFFVDNGIMIFDENISEDNYNIFCVENQKTLNGLTVKEKLELINHAQRTKDYIEEFLRVVLCCEEDEDDNDDDENYYVKEEDEDI